MSGIWKSNIELSIFGESHGSCVGITINGLKPGHSIDESFIQSELNRRKPGKSALETSRKEDDKFEILSGIFEGKTTGAPITMIIKNTNTRSRDYEGIKDRLRPGHADYPAGVKYLGYTDYRGGGHFSGRLTAGLVFAGALAKCVLKDHGIKIFSHIDEIAGIEDKQLASLINKETLDLLNDDFPVIDKQAKEAMKAAIIEAKEAGDSVGGKVRLIAMNVPVGLGDPFFDSFESSLSQLIFSVPAVKALEFGSGVDLAGMKGSESNDAYYFDEGVKTTSNHNGGILGGITNGMPIDCRVTIKPTPSISKKQKSVNLATKENTDLTITGRHDPCIVPRVLPVLESVMAIAILDKMIR